MLLLKHDLTDLHSTKGAETGIISHGCAVKVLRPEMGIWNLTAAARPLEGGGYILRIIASLLPDTFLFSQEQPRAMQPFATRIKLDEKGRFTCKKEIAEVGRRFVHSTGAIGIRPAESDKVTFILMLDEKGKDGLRSGISGSIHYRAFAEHMIFNACTEAFSIRLS